MRALSGISKMGGYALSMLLLAIASLVAIPAMIRASGDAAWGAVALGQSIGAMSAVVVAYGWLMSGPARIARNSMTGRLTEYRSSLKVRLFLVIPAILLAVVPAAFLSPDRRDLAMAGALSMTLIGLTAQWFFVGLARPYVFLLVETVPRVSGTIIGIIGMNLGRDAMFGLLCQAAGMFGGFVCSTVWITRFLRASGALAEPVPRLSTLFRSRGDGLIASLGTAAYLAAPLIIVSVIAPASQPMYALADKVQRQVAVALGPGVTVLQGWVPRARNPRKRARIALAAGATAAIGLGAGVGLVGRPLVEWLGAGSLRPSDLIIVLMSIFVGVSFLESIVAKAVLATYAALKQAARATLVGAIIALPLVAVGARTAGPEGALAAVVGGIVIRLMWELSVASRLLGRGGAIEEGVGGEQ